MKNRLNLEVSLLEIILSIVIFTICCILVINSFIIARYTQIKANDKTIGIMKVQSALESIKASSNFDEVNKYLLDEFNEINYKSNIFVNYYDKEWNICEKGNEEFTIKVMLDNKLIKSGELININVRAEKLKPYPFIDKNKDNNQPIVSISTDKFFSYLNIGGW